jgi:hypothetical protein
MSKHYSGARREAYVSAEGKRRVIRQERTLARKNKTVARTLAGGVK